MSIESLLPILIPSIFVLYLVIERVRPGQPLPHVRGWFAKGIVFFFVAFALNGAGPALMATLLGSSTVLHLGALGTVAGALLVVLCSDLVGYWIHRTMHRVSALWRWTHQLHHSAERMDMLGASYMHPFDFMLANVIPGVLIVAFLGVTPAAAALGGILGFAMGVFPHLNVRTPTWVGFVLQRPEMHALHHTRDLHAYNYGNLALSDRLFGTWRNPAGFPAGPLGFWDGASKKVGAMLIGRDVSRPDGSRPQA